MRALAEFIMRGRIQAIAAAILAIVTVMFSWVGAAIVALVTLSRGRSEGLIVAMWVSLPTLAMAWQGNPLPLTTIIAGYMGGYALGMTRSWSIALLSQVIVSIGFAALLLTIDNNFVNQLMAMQQQMVAGSLTQVDEKVRHEVLKLLSDPVFITGALALSQMLFGVLSLVMGRYWQAMLYNPGGFGQEFHQLRLSPQLALLLTVLSMATVAQGGAYGIWALVLMMPLLLAGIGLVHWWVSVKGWSKQWLILFYILLLLSVMQGLLVVEILVIGALADSFLNLRKRIAAKGESD
ncbi:hypothetical protein EDC56_2102 [Sinobacterium caligoides]|uniref:Uncharacterized protein n=1 Tax=Sinobacterium caligoides TaxID=933926 RepID=A0A3N2DPB8_9GAMM|nr:hypothetical protein [Sinobacterium caligoides]ROS01658.1 hypothetical protein EDC56_2102 [Sinobacterium caligoides]